MLKIQYYNPNVFIYLDNLMDHFRIVMNLVLSNYYWFPTPLIEDLQ